MMIEGTLRTEDGVELHTYHWSAAGAAGAVVVLTHGYGEHAGRYDEFARYLVAQGHPTYAFDMRGHGRSPGQRGHIAPYRKYVDDLDQFFQHVARQHSDRQCVLLGHSHGGLTALLSVQHGRIQPAGMILTCPMVALQRSFRPVSRPIAAVLARVAPALGLANGIKVEQLTHDLPLAHAWRDSPLNHGRTSLGWYAGALDGMIEANQNLAKVSLPVLVLAGELDPVVDTRAVEHMFTQLASQDKEFGIVAGSYHEPLNELGRTKTFARIAQWLARRFT